MLSVPIPLPMVALPAHVMMATLEMESPVWVSIHLAACLRHIDSIPDINECTSGSDNCGIHTSCINTAGSFACACNQGYTGNRCVGKLLSCP